MQPITTLVELLQVRAEEDPSLKLYSFASGEAVQEISTIEVLAKAKTIGGYLQGSGLAGKQVIVICSPGPDPVLAFLGCIFAGAVAVPVPRPGKRSGADRIKAVLMDCDAAAVLTADEKDQLFLSELAGSAGVKHLPVNQIPQNATCNWKDPVLHSSSMAFIQYTSGSTGSPKGVVLSHSNLLSNAREMQEAFSVEHGDRGVLWLPLYHDMGLMGGVIQPIYNAYPTLFLSPLAFIERPLQWLKAISTTKATISGGPNFAYEICAQRAGELQPGDLDLSSWRVAFNGSETVRAETLARFISAFAPHGFNPTALRPCYGLAEATLLVSARNSSSKNVIHLDPEALKEKKLHELPTADSGAHTLVGVGNANPSHKTIIVDPDTRQICAEDEMGEIWVSGPSVAQGYWNKPEETELTFAACTNHDSNRRYLRTGDLGFIHQGQLFIAGRLKDLIIIRGQNFYPQDIEASVASCHPALQAGRGAAFSITNFDAEGMDGAGSECLVIVHEVSRTMSPGDADQIVQTIREQIANEFQLDSHAVVLIRQGSMPRTTSGKVQHQACRRAFLEGKLQVVATSIPSRGVAIPAGTEELGSRTPPRIESNTIYLRLLEAVARITNVPVQDLTAEMRLTALGLDSLKAAAIKIAIETNLGIDVPVSAILQGLNLGELAGLIQRRAAEVETRSSAPSKPAKANSYSLSAGQKALWFLQQLQPESSAYTVARAVRIRGPLDVAVFERAFAGLIERHASLRMVVGSSAREITQDVSSKRGFTLRVEDARQWDDHSLMAHIAAAAREPFQLESGPVFRVQLYIRSDEEAVLLLCAHHIAVDLWSFTTLAQELPVLYRACKTGGLPALASLDFEYADFVRWQAELLASPRRELLLDHWRERIENPPESLAFPAARQRSTHDSNLWHFEIESDLRDRAHLFARSRNVTLYGMLQAVLETLLHRYTGQSEFLIGTLSSGRNQKSSQGVVGYFINPLVLRPRFSGSQLFAEFLQSSYRNLVEALDHGDVPFSVLVEELHPRRDVDNSPLFDVMCIFQPASINNGPDLSSFIMGRKGGTLQVGDVVFESLEFSEADPQFALTLAACDTGQRIIAGLKYDLSRFDADFIRRMAAHFRVLLGEAALHPESPINSLSLMSDSEISQLTIGFNNTATRVRTDACIHTLIEEQVDRTPENIALVHQQIELTYREVDSRANQLANHLRKLGVKSESKVGLFLERSTDLVVGMLGILKAGAAYVALDPAHSAARSLAALQNSQAAWVVTHEETAHQLNGEWVGRCVYLDRDSVAIAKAGDQRPRQSVTSENLAYVMHTSGSTGRPKGVMIEHQNVINFLNGMDSKVPCGPGDTLLAVTSVSFDISILELLWTLTRGAKIVIANDATLTSTTIRRKQRQPLQDIRFSLFYFASAQTEANGDKYRLLLEGAKLADNLGFDAVWTPERHFHDFGGLYSNPSLTSAALAMTTSRVNLRGGSVVLPLHHPVRVAEEWAFVDNLSQGRVGIAFASGWHADDFVFAPQNYSSRKEVMYRGIEEVRQLWRGDALKTTGGSGNQIEIRIQPKPVQSELPVWITSAGAADTFEAAGRLHANVLTHLLGQELKEVAAKINLYRQSLGKAGRDPASGTVTLMLHTYLNNNLDQVRRKALEPFKKYLHSSLSLIANLVKSLKLDLDLEKMSEKDLDDLLAFAAERYMGTSGLFGSPETCREIIDAVRSMGVSEIACLIDFGIDFASTMQSIQQIAELQSIFNRSASPDLTYWEPQPSNEPTVLQCTPSYLRMLMHMESGRRMLGSLRMLLLGGEPVPAALIQEISKDYPGPILNMYGPTETTIWSAVQPISSNDEQILIGGPIANTQLRILDAHMALAPIGITGEVYLGGHGLARGYLGSPELTAERFLPDPYSSIPGARLYRTGDLGRLHEDGRIELAGRVDQQVKIRGYRIELGDIEASLNRAPGVATAAVIKRERGAGEAQLVGYLVASNGSIDLNAVREFLREQLPPYMVPNQLHVVRELPLTANGKINRNALLSAEIAEPRSSAPLPLPGGGLQTSVLEIWKRVLKVESISIDDNFFDIGGHSLLMVQVHEQLQRMLQRTFPLIALLQHPTIRSIAGYLENSDGPGTPSSVEKAAQQRAALISQRQRALALRA